MLATWLALAPRAAAERPAFSGTLADYLALGSEGLVIGDLVFSDFQLQPTRAEAQRFRSDFIDVIPLGDELAMPGFRFAVMDGATADDLFELHLSFRVAGVQVGGASLSLESATIREEGAVEARADLSVDGAGSGSLGSLSVSAGEDGASDVSETASLALPEGFGVDLDVVVDGGGIGRPGEVTASLSSVVLRFQTSSPPLRGGPRVTGAGAAGTNTFFIEFVSDPDTRHIVTASAGLRDGFETVVPLISGDGTTDQDGRGRVEFDVSTFPRTAFFRVETAA